MAKWSVWDWTAKGFGKRHAARFGLGPYVIADGKIIALNDHEALTLAEA